MIPVPNFRFELSDDIKEIPRKERLEEIADVLNVQCKFFEKDKSTWEPWELFETKLKKQAKINTKEYEYEENINLYRYVNNSLVTWKSLNKEKDALFINKNNDLIFETNKNYIFLE